MLRKIRIDKVAEQSRPELRHRQSISLPWMLTVPFIVQIATVVGLVGYLSYRNAQLSIEDLTSQLMDAVNNRLEQKITRYLETAHLANQINSDAVQRGTLDLDFDRPNPQTEQFLWQQMELFPNLTWISIGTESGSTLGVWRPGDHQNVQISIANRANQYYGTYYDTNEHGLRTTKLKVERPAFDPRTRPWYKAAISSKQATWTGIYPGFSPGTVFIGASQPLYDHKGKLLGVSGIDISLIGIQKFLALNPATASGQIFLMERSGLLVASSSQERPFRSLRGQPLQRVDVRQSQTPLIQETAQFLEQQFGDFKLIRQREQLRYTLNHQAQFVQVLPFTLENGLDWLIVIVVPESDVMANIHTGTQTTVGLCLAAVVGVIALNTVLSRWLVKPIVGLSQASQKIAQGDFSSRINAPSILELSMLADSFSQMSEEIQQSRQQLEDYSRSLEQKVSDRTQALQAEVELRATAETALQAANQKLQRLVYLDGLTQIPNRRLFNERLQLEWGRMKREKLPLSLILCDVDFFKPYNDTYGHQAGDDCLCHVAQAIFAAARRHSDLAARYGGEEFAVLLPNTPLKGATGVANMIQIQVRKLRLPHRQSSVSPYVSISLGVVTLTPTEDGNPNQLLEQADHALYQAKLDGRDRIAIGKIA